MIEKRLLGRTNLEVTRIGFGALEIGRNSGIGGEAAQQKPDTESAAQMLHGVLQSGVNLIDSARVSSQRRERRATTRKTLSKSVHAPI